jgi:CxxC motif-containing protein (DUF1111 family)
MKMKSVLVCFLCIAISIPLFAENKGYSVKYTGGSLPDISAGSGIKVAVDQSSIRFFKGKREIASFPASAVTEISYGQDVHRRVGTAAAVGVFTLGVGALVALSKSKKHFIGVTWDDGEQKGGLAIQCDKNDYRGILAALEGVSGKKAVNSENMNVAN